jgi:Na+/H+-dicarboxylate symporter
MTQREPEGRPLGTRILIGLVLGIGTGIFFGELCRPLRVVGDVFVGLLQMTVLPFIIVTLIANIGRLSLEKGKTLFGRAAIVWLGLLLVGATILVFMSLAFPERRAPAFFSAGLFEAPPEPDLLELFVPINIFQSLVNNAVPGVVLFCTLVGVALIGIPEKQQVIRGLQAAGDAIARVNDFVIQLTPYGLFAIGAATAGTTTVDEFGRLRGYFLVFGLSTAILAFWILPMIVTACTPFRYRDVIRAGRDAIFIAFSTGKILVVLPILIRSTQRMFAERALQDRVTGPSVDVLYPLAYPFPHLGKVIALLFVPFAAAFVGRSLELGDYPGLFGLGIVSLFGGPMITIPFLLESSQLPSDMFQLFIISGVFTSRLGDVVGVMNLVAFTAITTCALTGSLRMRWARFGWVLASGVLLVGAASVGSGIYLESVKDDYQRKKVIAGMHLWVGDAPTAVLERAEPNPVPLTPGQSRIERIHATGVLRVGFNDDNLPYAFRNARGELVGMAIEMAHRLAEDLGARLEFVPFERTTLAQQLADDHFDIAMSGLIGTLERSEQMRLSRPYLDATFSLIVRDHRARDLESLEKLAGLRSLRVGILTESQFARALRRHVPRTETVVVPSTKWFFETPHDLDALILSAEAGAAWTILYPDFQVVVPTRRKLAMPLVFPMPNGDLAFAELIDFWISSQERSGGVAELYDYWILGKGAEVPAPRWSVLRDVLGWIE